MPKCKICRKSSVLVLFSSVGLCGKCDGNFYLAKNKAIEDFQRELNAANNCKTKRAVLDHLNKANESLTVLLFYQERKIKSSKLLVDGRLPSEWRRLIEEKKVEVSEKYQQQDERLRICPYCRGVHSKPIRRGRDCEFCGKPIRVYRGKTCTLEKYEQFQNIELEKMKKERARNQLENLRDYKQSKIIRRVQILAARDNRTCPNCAQLNGKILSLEEAHTHLPALFCSSEYCRCTFVPVIEE